MREPGAGDVPWVMESQQSPAWQSMSGEASRERVGLVDAQARGSQSVMDDGTSVYSDQLMEGLRDVLWQQLRVCSVRCRAPGLAPQQHQLQDVA